jgi:hypothetical protein
MLQILAYDRIIVQENILIPILLLCQVFLKSFFVFCIKSVLKNKWPCFLNKAMCCVFMLKSLDFSGKNLSVCSKV